MKKILFVLISLITLFSPHTYASESEYVSAQNGSILDYDETKVLCEITLNTGSGKTTLGFLKKYAQKLESNDTKEFLFKYGTSIQCYGRSYIYFVLYKGHQDDIQALLDAGLDPNWIIEDTRYRKMTMVDYLNILYAEETNDIYKYLIRKKIQTVRRAGGRTCARLNYTTCEFNKSYK
ncbi:hypothetical protein HBN50_03390 [Halobacteriovorax sp. GB3]|uniref:hypothetical protein n=1 Tax=Halobacteriovorax sp. GB3 TaxID=2719615 RepID=UPI002360AD0F|nr:hypothetical protein [Halobacteriovorax sp. GB3]MDD0852121.1 hypothetical protein [Halobacteriovorax sp. GB3]